LIFSGKFLDDTQSCTQGEQSNPENFRIALCLKEYNDIMKNAKALQWCDLNSYRQN